MMKDLQLLLMDTREETIISEEDEDKEVATEVAEVTEVDIEVEEIEVTEVVTEEEVIEVAEEEEVEEKMSNLLKDLKVDSTEEEAKLGLKKIPNQYKMEAMNEF